MKIIDTARTTTFDVKITQQLQTGNNGAYN